MDLFLAMMSGIVSLGDLSFRGQGTEIVPRLLTLGKGFTRVWELFSSHLLASHYSLDMIRPLKRLMSRRLGPQLMNPITET